jgi:hypothetical protein
VASRRRGVFFERDVVVGGVCQRRRPPCDTNDGPAALDQHATDGLADSRTGTGDYRGAGDLRGIHAEFMGV